VDVELGIEVDADIGASFAIKDLEYWYPENLGSSEKTLEPKQAQTPLVLNAGIEATGKAEVSAHLIPKIVVGVDALNEWVKAGVYLELDIWGSAKATAKASASVTATKGGKQKRGDGIVEYTPPHDHHARALAKRGASAGFTGEVTVEAGIDLVGGFEGKVGSLYNDKYSKSFASKKWTLFSKSFTAGNAKREVSNSGFTRRDLETFSKPDEKPKPNTSKPGVQCPKSVVSFATLVSEKAKALSWKGGVDYPSTHKSGGDI